MKSFANGFFFLLQYVEERIFANNERFQSSLQSVNLHHSSKVHFAGRSISHNINFKNHREWPNPALALKRKPYLKHRQEKQCLHGEEKEGWKHKWMWFKVKCLANTNPIVAYAGVVQRAGPMEAWLLVIARYCQRTIEEAYRLAIPLINLRLRDKSSPVSATCNSKMKSTTEWSTTGQSTSNKQTGQPMSIITSYGEKEKTANLSRTATQAYPVLGIKQLFALSVQLTKNANTNLICHTPTTADLHQDTAAKSNTAANIPFTNFKFHKTDCT